MIKKFFWVLLISIFFFILFNLKWVTYGLRQAKGQFEIIQGSIPMSDLVSDPNSPDTLIEKLQFIDSVKRYASEEIGLVESNIYESLYDQGGEPVMYVVVAAYPFELKEYQWKIPMVASFPYLGFFDKDLALRELDKVQRLGYDARIRTVDGWSTLGFLPNPLLSNNLTGTEGELANLILHEIAHETIYIYDSTDLNENLASFIGDVGTLELLKDFYGDSSAQLQNYVKYELSYQTYIEHMLRGAHQLKDLYESFDPVDTLSNTRNKKLAIQRIVSSLDTLEKFGYNSDIFENGLPNNSYFLSILRYNSNQTIFRKELNEQFFGDFPEYVKHLKERYSSN